MHLKPHSPTLNSLQQPLRTHSNLQRHSRTHSNPHNSNNSAFRTHSQLSSRMHNSLCTVMHSHRTSHLLHLGTSGRTHRLNSSNSHSSKRFRKGMHHSHNRAMRSLLVTLRHSNRLNHNSSNSMECPMRPTISPSKDTPGQQPPYKRS